MANHLQQRDLELFEMPSIQSQMPITFKNGNSWTHIEGTCACCKKSIPSDKILGQLNMFDDNLCTVEAVGYCAPCNMVTRFLFRLHSDMRLTSPANGKWEEWRPSNSLFSKALNFFTKSNHVSISTKKMRP